MWRRNWRTIKRIGAIKIPVIEIKDTKTKQIKFDTSTKCVGMIKAKLKKYGITNFHIKRNHGEYFYIYTNKNGNIHRIGTAKYTQDNRFCVDKLFVNKIRELN